VFTLEIAFGTNSVRALLVRCSDGAEFGGVVADYPSGYQRELLAAHDHLLARQHPDDHLSGMERAVKAALAEAKTKQGFSVDQVVGEGVDTTGSSPLPVDASNQDLARPMKKLLEIRYAAQAGAA